MIIESIEVHNFRSISQEQLHCHELTALVGRNGSGKSSWLKALDVFYDLTAKISIEDFFNKDPKTPIEIRLTFGGLTERELDEFATYVRDNKLIVTKKISYADGTFTQKYYSASLQIPEFADIRSIVGKGDRRDQFNNLVDSGKFDTLSERVRSADRAEEIMRAYEQEHPELLQPVEKEEQFFGPKNIGGGKLDKYTKYVLVPAVREAAEEIEDRRGSLDQLLDLIVLRKVNAREDVRQLRTKYEQEIRKVYSTDNLTELSELGDEISKTLEKFAPATSLRLKWGDVNPPEIKLPKAEATLVEDRFEGDISRKGHGVQRALILTLLQHLALTTVAPLPAEHEELADNQLPPTDGYLGPDLILAIEEPELYLHPSRCRYLAELLMDIAENKTAGLGTRNQVLYTTHSPYFVDLERFDHLRLVRKISINSSVPPETIVRQFSLQQAAGRSNEIAGDNIRPATAVSFKARAMPVMNVIVNEGFFADAVLVVEGLSEIGVFWRLQEIVGKDWSARGIAIIPTTGKSNLDRPVIVFQGFGIPTYFVFDGDSNARGRQDEGQAGARNRRYLTLGNGRVEDFPSTTVTERYGVFSTSWEDECRKVLGDQYFIAACHDVARQLGYEEDVKALKNIEVAGRFIEKVYKDGKSLPILEKIVDSVTSLVP